MEQETVKRMLDHMNDDHADAVRLYVIAYTDVRDVDSAILQNIDEQGLDIMCYVAESERRVRIDFEKPLEAADEVRDCLVSMVNQARHKLA